VAFNATLSAGMNGGIVGAIIALNSAFVMVSAYIMFGESLTKIKFLCMLFLMSSVVLVTLFPPE
jgi:drug/metabolite transporter (DMT)-like permease